MPTCSAQRPVRTLFCELVLCKGDNHLYSVASRSSRLQTGKTDRPVLTEDTSGWKYHWFLTCTTVALTTRQAAP